MPEKTAIRIEDDRPGLGARPSHPISCAGAQQHELTPLHRAHPKPKDHGEDLYDRQPAPGASAGVT